MNCSDTFTAWQQAALHEVENALATALPRADEQPQRLHEAMRYALLGGGKRIRALLALAGGEVTGATRATSLTIACAVEMIHAYSLVHDDLPAMDNDVLRRGKPTCHVAYDEACALLVGDALQTAAFTVLSQPLADVDAAAQLKAVQLLAQASGSLGMAGGQAIDLAAVEKTLTQDELQTMHSKKTGALITAPLLMSAAVACAPTPIYQALAQFGDHAGLLFQVVDDILDCTANTATLGKTAGKDEQNHKPTYVSLMGLDAARRYAQTLYQNALAALEVCGPTAARLKDLAQVMAQRAF